ncbi:helix-turn-helix domain-containing protein [Pseudonocardia nematodicida]|uniref:Helix-turn-helix domain-containing protein n=1 Tax=Pseudonocardia nematodicida TaxID=1206997 RepID=A0ABV1KCD7_9PSEU
MTGSTAAPLPPPIPLSHTGTDWSRGTCLLVWARTGRVHVALDHGDTHRLEAGEGLWVPADRGRRIRTCPGTVAFPYAVPPGAVATAPADPVRFEVRPEWHDRLIQHYVHFVAPVTSFGYSRASLLEVVDPAAGQALPAAGPDGGPPWPTGDAARAVAEALVRDPALDHTAERWAGLVACSSRTLHREFVRGTGLTFAQWRTACRLAVACDLLAAGEEVGRVAVRTGFAGRNGFARAFRQSHGITPREYSVRLRRRGADPSRRPAQHPSPVPRSGVLAQVLGGTAGARPLPATQTPPHANGVHVLTWMYRGSGYLRIDGETHHLGRGDATWIPAGRDHQFGTHADSIALPLGHLDPDDADIDLTGPLRARFPPSWDDYLLHCSVSARTPLRPDGHDRRAILEMFHRQLAADRARSVPMPADPRARAAADAFLRRMREPPGGAVDRSVHEAFGRETGMTFARWRHAARMRTARELLTAGTTPSSVARQVGYTQVSNFSRAFSRFHGESARDYSHRNR